MPKIQTNPTGALAEADLRITKKLMPKVSATIRKDSKLRKRLWSTLAALNQNNTSQCVSFSGIQWLFAAPIENKVTKWFNDPSILHKQVQKMDGMTHHKDAVTKEGSNLGGLFNVLKQEGFVKEYFWAGNGLGAEFYFKGTELVDTCVSHVLSKGPIVVATQLFTSMNPATQEDVDEWGWPWEEKEGFWNIDPISGGAGFHAYVLKGIDLDKKCPDKSVGAFKIINSWGTNWAINGEAWISLRDADILFSLNAEAVTANELLKGTRIG